MEEFAIKLLPDFKLIRERPFDSLSTEFEFKRESDSVHVFINIGLYHSDAEALNIATEYLKEISALMAEGAHNGLIIGDKYWWWTPGSNYDIVIDLVLLRKNGLFIMSCSTNFKDLETLAKEFDDDILKEESYITFFDQ
jgi:hypothetical protein